MDLLSYFIPKQAGAGQPQATPQEVDPEKLGPKEIFFAWQALGRVEHQGFNEKLMRTFAIIGVFVALFLVIVQEYLLILVVVSMVFVGQVLAKTPPENAKFEISSHGISIDDTVYYWQQMRRFFFFEQEGTKSLILAVDLTKGFPSRLFMTINPSDQPKIKEVLGQRLHFLEAVPETLLDKTYKSVTSKFAS